MSSREVVIFGAGFSAAISPRMPLLNSLGTAAIERAGLTGDPRVPTSNFSEGFTFENWLTTLAEDQPHLSSVANGDNAALFLKLRSAMVEVLTEAEQAALKVDPPPWLSSLILLLHHRHATAITFNYDRLIEIALERLIIVDTSPQNLALVGTRDALWNRPPVPVGDDVYGGDILPTFRLLKLHGSLDWWIAPYDETGSTLVRKRLEIINGAMRAMSDAERSQLLPGREVFAIPPTHSKAPYYRNLFTRELWSSSYEALSAASTISIIGYSLPAADAILSGMLEQATRGREVTVEVVNLNPDPIVKRLREMGIHNVCEIAGDECVAEFVEKYSTRANDRFRHSMRLNGPLAPPDYPVVMTTKMVDGENLFYRVIDLQTEGTCLVLDAIPRGRNFMNAASNDALGDVQPRAMSVEIAKALEATSKVIVRSGGRTFLPVSAVPASGPIPGGPLALLVNAIETHTGSEMDATEWSAPLSRAHHEAGHVVAAHLQGIEVSSATISDDEGLGATSIDTLDNHEAAAVIAYAGLASQILFDDSHNVTDEWWLIDRESRTLDDQELAREAIKALLGAVEFSTKLAESNRLREVSREMVASERAQLLIARVAQALNQRVSLDEEQIRLLLNEN